MTFTREDYMARRCTHRQYYAQFVTENIKRQVLAAITLKRLMASRDRSFNDIPLYQWDMIHQDYTVRHGLATRFKAERDNSLSSGTCIVKEAARQIVEAEVAKQLATQYPPERFDVCFERDHEGIARLLCSTASTTWGTGPIPDTEYYQLALCSPEKEGDKQTVIVCKQSAVK